MVLDGPIPPKPGIRYVITLDVGLVNDRTIVVVAHREEARVVVDFLCRWQGSKRKPVDLDEVEAALVDLHGSYPGLIRIDPAKAEHILQRLRRRGLPIVEFAFTTTSVGLLAGALLRALRWHQLLLPDDEIMRAELLAVRIVENSAGVPRLTHDSAGHDDHAVALALAVHELMERSVGGLIFADDDGQPSRDPTGKPFRQQVQGGRYVGSTALPSEVSIDAEDQGQNGQTMASPFHS
jgi:hypothetical protein